MSFFHTINICKIHSFASSVDCTTTAQAVEATKGSIIWRRGVEWAIICKCTTNSWNKILPKIRHHNCWLCNWKMYKFRSHSYYEKGESVNPGSAERWRHFSSPKKSFQGLLVSRGSIVINSLSIILHFIVTNITISLISLISVGS